MAHDEIKKEIQEAIDKLKEENQIAQSELFQSVLNLIDKQREERIKLEVRLQYILQQFAHELDIDDTSFGEIINTVHDFVETNWDELKKEIHDVDSLRRQIDSIARDKFQKDIEGELSDEAEEDEDGEAV